MHADGVITLPRAPAPRASILIIAAAVEPRLLRCLQSLALASPTVAFDTTVVLDGVSEEAADAVRAGLAGVRVEAFATTLGLAGALNRGREFVRGEFLVTLQDDTEVRQGWLEGLVAAADEDPGAGAVGSLVLNPDGSVQSAGYELTADFNTQPPWGTRTPDPCEFREVRAVDYCGSCSLLVRTDVWDLVGGADERVFPLYPVDIDLCLAIRMRGRRVLCAPASVLVHERGASITPDYAVFVQQRNRKLMLEKWGRALEGHVPGSGAVRVLAAAELRHRFANGIPSVRRSRSWFVGATRCVTTRSSCDRGSTGGKPRSCSSSGGSGSSRPDLKAHRRASSRGCERARTP